MLLTDVLTQYAISKADEVMAPRAIGFAIDALTPFWEGRTVVAFQKSGGGEHRQPSRRNAQASMPDVQS